MSLSITQAPGFNQAEYNKLIEQAASENVDTGLVDQLILNAVSKGKSFDQALNMVGAKIPKLADPTSASFAALSSWPGIPSPGALIMQATTEFAAEQRRQNQEVAFAETKAIVESMHNEAKDMRETAKDQLILGVVSGAVQIGVGVASGIISARGALKAANEASEASSKVLKEVTDAGDEITDAVKMTASKAAQDPSKTALDKANTISQSVTSVGSGISKVMDSTSQYLGTMGQARWKEMQADQEQMRAMRDSIKSLNDSLADVIRKSLAAQNDIQANANQTRTKILA